MSFSQNRLLVLPADALAAIKCSIDTLSFFEFLSADQPSRRRRRPSSMLRYP